MRIKNLTGSPYELTDKDGKKIILPAFGVVDIDPHPNLEPYYSTASYFDVSESSKKKRG